MIYEVNSVIQAEQKMEKEKEKSDAAAALAVVRDLTLGVVECPRLIGI